MYSNETIKTNGKNFSVQITYSEEKKKARKNLFKLFVNSKKEKQFKNFLKNESLFFDLLANEFIKIIKDYDHQFNSSTSFLLSISPKFHNELKFYTNSSDEFHCTIIFPLNVFAEMVLKFLKSKKVSDKFAEYIIHEIAHYIDFLSLPSLLLEAEKIEQEKIQVDNRHWFKVVLVFLRSEGLAELLRKKNKRTVTLDFSKIKTYRNNLQLLTYSFDLNPEELQESFHYFFQKLGYPVGYLMCFTIALAELKQKPGTRIQLPNGKFFSWSQVNKLFKHNLKIKNIDPTIIELAFNKIKLCHVEEFIELYEWACKELNLSKRYRVIWYSLYQYWNKIMYKEREEYLNKKRKQAGLQPPNRKIQEISNKIKDLFS
jgi:hypothetical protein